MLSLATVCVLSTTTHEDPEVQKMTSLTAHFVEPHRDVRREWTSSTWSPSNSTPHYNFNGKSTFFTELILEKYSEVGQRSLSLSCRYRARHQEANIGWQGFCKEDMTSLPDEHPTSSVDGARIFIFAIKFKKEFRCLHGF